jgi:hypothetical protein
MSWHRQPEQPKRQRSCAILSFLVQDGSTPFTWEDFGEIGEYRSCHPFFGTSGKSR